MNFTKNFMLWEQSQLENSNGKLISSNEIELIDVTIDEKTIKHQNGNTSKFTVPMKENRSKSLNVVWKIKNNSKSPIIINNISGSNLSYKKINVPDWNKTPISPGKTVDIKIDIQTINGSDLNILCRENFSIYNNVPIFVNIGGSVKHTVKFIVKFDRQVAYTSSEIAEYCEIKDNEATHNSLLVAEIATAFIPVIGPFISSGIALYDAKRYWDEGDKETAGLFAMLTLLPVIGPITKKIPGIKALGTSGMGTLAKKFTPKGTLKKGLTLSKNEKAVLISLDKNKVFVKGECSNWVKQKASSVLSKVNKPEVKKQLGDLAKTGLTYVGASVAYSTAYSSIAKSGSLGLNEYLKTKGYQTEDINTVKTLFGSSGSGSDNEKLINAMKDGWKPGNIVPEKYRTDLYLARLKEDTDRINNLKNKLKELGYA